MRHLPQLFLVAILVAILATYSPLWGQDAGGLPPEISLWADGAPGSESRAEEPESVRPGPDRVISNIHDPTITPYLPPASEATGAAVIVAPGGGHRELWSAHEGHNPARYFMERGIAAFVLEYRLAEEEDSPYTVDEHALGDMQRAIRTVRAHSEEWNVRSDRIGVMGFSAGGELVALAGMRPDAGQPDSADPVERESSRPDFLAMIYPGRSSRYEFGEDTPPTFIVAGFNDRQDISEGMAEVYLQLKRAGVPTEMHIYSEAGHGFGLRPDRPGSVMTRPARFVDWLGDRGLLNPP